MVYRALTYSPKDDYEAASAVPGWTHVVASDPGAVGAVVARDRAGATRAGFSWRDNDGLYRSVQHLRVLVAAWTMSCVSPRIVLVIERAIMPRDGRGRPMVSGAETSYRNGGRVEGMLALALEAEAAVYVAPQSWQGPMLGAGPRVRRDERKRRVHERVPAELLSAKLRKDEREALCDAWCLSEWWRLLDVHDEAPLLERAGVLG